MPTTALKHSEELDEQIDDRVEASGLAGLVPEYGEIDGWLTVEEAELLFQTAAQVASGGILEIGSYRGRSTVALAAGSRNGSKLPVFAVEPHESSFGVNGVAFGPKDRRQFLKTLLKTKLFNLVRLVNATSSVVAPGWKTPIALLFIDGDYRYEAVRSYFADWRSVLMDGASVLFYGATEPGPARLIGELVDKGILSALISRGNLAILKFSAARAEAEPDSIEVETAIVPERLAPAAKTSIYPAVVFEIKDKEPRHDIGRAARYVYYGGNGRYLYQPIPKCACTSMKTTLLELENLPVDPNEWRRHNKKFNGFPGAEHLPTAEQLALFEGKTNTFKFVFVRDPYGRMASVYSDKILKGYEKKSKYWIKLIKEAAKEQGVSLSEKITFDEFVRVASAQKLKKMDPHWRPQYDVGRFGMIKWDFIGHLEMLATDLLYVLEQIDAPKELIDKAVQPQNVTGSKLDIWAEVSAETRRIYHKAFEIDFDILRYPLRQHGLW